MNGIKQYVGYDNHTVDYDHAVGMSSFLSLFRWAVKDGQFDDPEEAKYVIFREDERSSR